MDPHDRILVDFIDRDLQITENYGITREQLENIVLTGEPFEVRQKIDKITNKSCWCLAYYIDGIEAVRDQIESKLTKEEFKNFNINQTEQLVGETWEYSDCYSKWLNKLKNIINEEEE